MKRILWMLFCVALIGGGCRSVEITSKARASVIGRPVQSVIDASAGLRIEIFDQAGKPLAALPRQRGGSVSVHNADDTGQDNYRFDAHGVIDKHQRSDGANYAAGIWEDVE
jgi:hypothetical protein